MPREDPVIAIASVGQVLRREIGEQTANGRLAIGLDRGGDVWLRDL